MKIEKRKKGDVLVLDLKGKILIGDGIDELRDSINGALKEKETKILLNFSDVPYLDSTGLGEVVRSYTSIKKEGGNVKIVNLTNKVKDLLSVTKLLTVFETFEDEDKAVETQQAICPELKCAKLALINRVCVGNGQYGKRYKGNRQGQNTGNGYACNYGHLDQK